MNALDHVRTAERLLSRSGPLRCPELNHAPELIHALVHAVLAVALKDDGSLATGQGAQVVDFPQPNPQPPDN